jgi:hypothetical protein
MREPTDFDVTMTSEVIAEVQYSRQVMMQSQTRSSSKFVFSHFTVIDLAMIAATITSSNAYATGFL